MPSQFRRSVQDDVLMVRLQHTSHRQTYENKSLEPPAVSDDDDTADESSSNDSSTVPGTPPKTVRTSPSLRDSHTDDTDDSDNCESAVWRESRQKRLADLHHSRRHTASSDRVVSLVKTDVSAHLSPRVHQHALPQTSQTQPQHHRPTVQHSTHAAQTPPRIQHSPSDEVSCGQSDPAPTPVTPEPQCRPADPQHSQEAPSPVSSTSSSPDTDPLPPTQPSEAPNQDSAAEKTSGRNNEKNMHPIVEHFLDFMTCGSSTNDPLHLSSIHDIADFRVSVSDTSLRLSEHWNTVEEDVFYTMDKSCTGNRANAESHAERPSDPCSLTGNGDDSQAWTSSCRSNATAEPPSTCTTFQRPGTPFDVQKNVQTSDKSSRSRNTNARSSSTPPSPIPEQIPTDKRSNFADAFARGELLGYFVDYIHASASSALQGGTGNTSSTASNPAHKTVRISPRTLQSFHIPLGPSLPTQPNRDNCTTQFLRRRRLHHRYYLARRHRRNTAQSLLDEDHCPLPTIRGSIDIGRPSNIISTVTTSTMSVSIAATR